MYGDGASPTKAGELVRNPNPAKLNGLHKQVSQTLQPVDPADLLVPEQSLGCSCIPRQCREGHRHSAEKLRRDALKRGQECVNTGIPSSLYRVARCSNQPHVCGVHEVRRDHYQW